MVIVLSLHFYSFNGKKPLNKMEKNNKTSHPVNVLITRNNSQWTKYSLTDFFSCYARTSISH